MRPLKLPKSDIHPHSMGELRAAYQERVNESGLDADKLLQALRYADDKMALEILRFLLRRDECMRINLERAGVPAPPPLDFSIDGPDDRPLGESEYA